ncbi:MAG: hypothetical protein AUJ92_20185 [Armatimonadetes bacterium CG2_30_59_28]|nr:MAG: hypothetical protein AUJ92_20185 [Armatimonadetes bacterium CG2_30_59_28]
MTSRERIRETLNHRVPDRVPMVDICFWPETVERWRAEGLPAGISPTEYFGLDEIGVLGFQANLQLPEETLDETDDYVVRRDADGAVVRSWKNNYATPSRLDATIKTWDDWNAHKENFGGNVSVESIGETYRQLRERDCFITIRPCEPMWYFLEHLMGFEMALETLAEQPDFVADVIRTHTEFNHRLMQQLIDAGMEFDGLWFFSDLCYKNGMLYSPKVHRELVLPSHQATRAFCDRHDLPMIFHCDGYMGEMIPLLIAAGFDAMQPIEARCGNDIRKYKKQYGADIVFFGNISTDVMCRTKDEIFEEVSTKVTAAKEGGGYMYHCDHSIPPTVSFENYSFVIDLVRQYGGYES